MTSRLPPTAYSQGGFGLTPFCIATFYSATALSVRWFSDLSNSASLNPLISVHLCICPPSLMHQQRLMPRPHPFSSRNSLHSQLLRDLQMVMLPPLRACSRKTGSLSTSCPTTSLVCVASHDANTGRCCPYQFDPLDREKIVGLLFSTCRRHLADRTRAHDHVHGDSTLSSCHKLAYLVLG